MNGDGQPPRTDPHVVRVTGVPARLHLQSDDYLDELLREFELVGLCAPRALERPAELLGALDSILDEYASERMHSRRQVENALLSGSERAALRMQLPRRAAAAAELLMELFGRVQEACASGQLLTLPAPPEVASYLRELLTEVARQLRGGDPRQQPAFSAIAATGASEVWRLPPPAPPLADRTPRAKALVDTPLAADPSSVARARRLLRERVETEAEVVEAATLCLSELVTNAVLHAGEGVRLIVARGDGILRVEVHDEQPLLPTPRSRPLDAGIGRGLGLVDAVADRWGVAPTEHGKCVWFELEQPRNGHRLQG